MPNLPTTITPGFPGHIGDHEEMHAILDDLDTGSEFGITQFKQGVHSNRPAAGIAGRFWFSSNIPALYFDTGAAWQLIAPAIKRASDAASAQLTLTASYQDIPGLSIDIATVTANAPFWAVGVGAFDLQTVGTGNLEFAMLVNGAAQAELGVFNATPTGGYIASVTQTWEGVCGGAGTQNFKMQAKKSTGSGVAVVAPTNTTLLVVVYDG